MGQDLIRYDVLAQEAFRGLVRKVIQEVARAGLPGDHHFYITFDTRAPGVRISSQLRQRFPEEVTIVLQHQYWDLSVTEHAFEVGLSFAGVPERILVPFTAIRFFRDPSVEFMVEFVVEGVEKDEPAEDAPADAAVRPIGKPAAPRAAEVRSAPSDGGTEAPAAETAPEGEEKGASVVSLDAFRKKT